MIYESCFACKSFIRFRLALWRLVKSATDVLEALGALAWAGMNPAPRTALNVPIGPHRRVEFVRASLEDFKTIKNALGGTVNDVVLAVVTGALRRFLQHRGVDVRGLELKAMVPMSTAACPTAAKSSARSRPVSVCTAGRGAC